jgi:hypothetical protein
LESPALTAVLEGLGATVPTMPEEVRRERADICRLLLVHHFAERERAIADGTGGPRASWATIAAGLVDVIVGVWLSPHTPVPSAEPAAFARRALPRPQ